MRATYGHYALDTCARFYIVRFFSSFAAMYILNTSRRALKLYRKTRKTGYCAHKNERESPTCGRKSGAKAGKINGADRDRARHSSQTADA